MAVAIDFKKHINDYNSVTFKDIEPKFDLVVSASSPNHILRIFRLLKIFVYILPITISNC